MLIKLKQIEIFFDDVEKFLSQLLSCGHGIVVMLFIFYREIRFSPREGPQLFFFSLKYRRNSTTQQLL